MNPKKIQPKKLELTPSQLAKVNQRKADEEASKVPIEWRLVSEFGDYYGWASIRAVMDNEIDIDQFNLLLKAGRKRYASKMVDLNMIIFTGVAATKSKKPQTYVNKALKHFIKEARS